MLSPRLCTQFSLLQSVLEVVSLFHPNPLEYLNSAQMESSAVITPEIKDAANQRRTKESGAPANTSAVVGAKIRKKW